MRNVSRKIIGIVATGTVGLALAGVAVRQASMDSQYRLSPDSMAQEGVPKGEIRGPFVLPCAVYPGTRHTY